MHQERPCFIRSNKKRECSDSNKVSANTSKKQRMLKGKSSNRMMKRNKRKHFLDITLMSISAFNHNHQKQDSIKTTPKTICQVSGKVSISIT